MIPESTPAGCRSFCPSNTELEVGYVICTACTSLSILAKTGTSDKCHLIIWSFKCSWNLSITAHGDINCNSSICVAFAKEVWLAISKVRWKFGAAILYRSRQEPASAAGSWNIWCHELPPWGVKMCIFNRVTLRNLQRSKHCWGRSLVHQKLKK